MRTTEILEQIADLVIDVLIRLDGVRDALPKRRAISTAEAMDCDLDGCSSHPEVFCRVGVGSGTLVYGQKSAEAIKEMLVPSGHEFLAQAVEDAGEKRERPLPIVETLRSL